LVVIWDDADAGDRHLNQLYLTTDGNHKLQRKKKHGDPEDASLLGDSGYFPNHQDYAKYIAALGESTDVGGQPRPCKSMLLTDFTRNRLVRILMSSTSKTK
jgi:hypothetical protein